MKNPYYALGTSEAPYLAVFNTNTEASKYNLIGKGRIAKNTFSVSLNDTIRWTGDCVLMVKKNVSGSYDIKAIGMTLNNPDLNKVIGFDLYGKANSAIKSHAPESFNYYIKLAEYALKRMHITENVNNGDRVYIKLVFV